MGKSSKAAKGLKSALQAQQSRLQKKVHAEKAAQALEQRSKTGAKGKGKGKVKVPARRPTNPFRATDTILLIGEGNFSFARALVVDAPAELEHLPATNITATAYDSEEECYAKYPDAETIVGDLRERGVHVIFGVDATRLDKLPALKTRKWDKIVWNFPHAGKGITDQNRNILSNQMLIVGFLRAASNLLRPGPIPQVHTAKKKKKNDDDEEDIGPPSDEDMEDLSSAPSTRGTVLITLRNVVPYSLWDVPRLAKHPPAPANPSMSPNPTYNVLRSFGERAHGTGKTGEGGEDRTWEFYVWH
ncbi:hypothetical protein BD626DRAFT_501772 [Schizophyllum amplum]|uniref:25S rRNA (uridine-N(3))-methyltransferase BMT5-like domain-containing protein n=1 Tax=Schizophyllum amplum TaxID=97359 RepID=A0A550CA44_9AGAR|nr:hypothetical protein BD626DRAFT_501772 [Auriculariopsis ampla]